MKRSHLSRPVLSSSPRAHQEAAAWDFLAAVRELFPERFAELEALGRYEAVRAPEWALKNKIACAAVDAVATQIAQGQKTPGDSFTAVLEVDEHWNPVDEPASIHALPLDETLDEFIHRAREHYQEVRTWFLERGYKKRPIKRERDHFRYLAAYLVGGYSWAKIARGQTPFKFPEKSVTTIAGEARKAARLVGISLPNAPGPRPGSHSRRPRRRA